MKKTNYLLDKLFLLKNNFVSFILTIRFAVSACSRHISIVEYEKLTKLNLHREIYSGRRDIFSTQLMNLYIVTSLVALGR